MFTFYFRNPRTYFSFTALPHHYNGHGSVYQRASTACSGPNPAHVAHGIWSFLVGTGPENSKDVTGAEDWRVAAEQHLSSSFPRTSRETEKKKPKLRLGLIRLNFQTSLESYSFPLKPATGIKPHFSEVCPAEATRAPPSAAVRLGFAPMSVRQYFDIYFYSPYTEIGSSNASVQLLAKLHITELTF